MNESENDDIRRMLAGLDPMAGVPVEPVTSPQARHRLEQIMQSTNTDDPVVTPLRRRPRTILAAASVAVLALGIGVLVSQNGNNDLEDVHAARQDVLMLKAPGGDPAMSMCLRFDAEGLRTMPVAFAGTVTRVDDKTATLDVDRWFKGGDADAVEIALPPGDISPALVPGVDFVKGQRFLVTATDGVVNGCGYSGPATADYEKTFDEAFPG